MTLYFDSPDFKFARAVLAGVYAAVTVLAGPPPDLPPDRGPPFELRIEMPAGTPRTRCRARRGGR